MSAEHHHHDHGHNQIDCCDPGPAVLNERSSVWNIMSRRQWFTLLVSGGLLLLIAPVNHWVFEGRMPIALSLALHLIAYFPVALPVWWSAWKAFQKGDYFNEFVLMGMATVGAFYVGEFAEGVAVMLFYTIGEWVQAAAVMRSRQSIKDLINSRPDHARKWTGQQWENVTADSVVKGDRLSYRVGERVAYDGKLTSEGPRSMGTASLTGESLPREISPGEDVLAGMVPVSRDIEMEVTRPLSESTLSRMLYLVEEAATRKAPSERLIRKLASYYTPIVFFAALVICIGPAFIVEEYNFDAWLYRALIFLVISCPCALVISIPLGFFGGLGAASRRGILIKGAQYLDALTKQSRIFFDKTGTLTTGKLTVDRIVWRPGFSDENEQMIAAAEHGIDHPLAIPIARLHPDAHQQLSVSHRHQYQGKGMEALVEQHRIILGNMKLMREKGIEVPAMLEEDGIGQVHIAIDGLYAGKVILKDEIKPEAGHAIEQLFRLGKEKLAIVSGDTEAHVAECARSLSITDYAHGLLPEEKLDFVMKAKEDHGQQVIFVGEGLNDAPVLAAADIGIAMGQLGSEAAIESADVVIQSDELTRIPTAIRIARTTRKVIWQNIGLALGLKILVLGLGVMGMASLWEAVFADVGVALLAIGNAVRLQRMSFE